MLASPAAKPAASYDEALRRARAVAALDDDTIADYARTRLLEHGERRSYAVVLLHGLTNNPNQYAKLALQVFELGANVFVPRMPEHGDKDRLTKRIASLTAERLLESTNEALDIACGLGERVIVSGISMGGLLSAYFGQYRSDVHTAVPIAPDFSLLQLPYGVTRMISVLLGVLPNFFVWWDPRVRDAQMPKTAYPWFSTRALLQTLRVGEDVYAAARREPVKAERIATVVNRTDPAVNNEVTSSVVSAWRARRNGGIEYVELNSLPENHDIIDPANPQERTDIVYPKLIEILGISRA
jgi:carboxylesterase